nr:MAG TPA: HK97 Family Phage Portal Protein [Caudoviricetes sp.]
MPYYITNNHPDCKSGWAVVKTNYEILACHKTKTKAISQMVAVSQAEGMEPGGTHPRDLKKESSSMKRLKEFDQDLYDQIDGDEKALVDAMLGVVQEFGKFQSEGSTINAGYDGPDTNPNLEIGVKCGNCVFHRGEGEEIECSAIEQDIEEDGACRFAMIPPGLVNAPSSVSEAAVSYKVPAGVQSAAKRALKWISEGKAGDGFTDVGRRRASQLASGGTVSRDVVARMKSYFARHANDRKATGFSSGEEGYPSPGRVAWDAWGGTAGQAWVNRINLEKK